MATSQEWNTMQLNVNGTNYEVADQPERSLLWVLRDELGLTGTKFSCQIGVCGTCTVHIDGQAAKSCQTLVSTLAGKQVRTIEGLAEDGQLHPVQQTFIEEQVPQCGWCQPAQMMTAAALLSATPNPDDEQVRAAMDGVYCRCGTYPRIRAAVKKAAEIVAVQREAA
jgi:isoquinoline 1-oxidoreductase alpha subunit